MTEISEFGAREPGVDKATIGILVFQSPQVNLTRYGLYPYRFSTQPVLPWGYHVSILSSS